MTNQSERVVTLIDMDCFYCQVEVRLNPIHTGKPLAVVQYNQWKGGGIIAVNYEAREKGVKRGMRGTEAKEKCPDIELVSVRSVRGKADLSKYRDAGKEVIEVFKEFCDCVERASIDEAYLDLTQLVKERTEKLVDSGALIKADELKSTFIVGFCADDNNDEDARTGGLKEFLDDQRYNPGTLRLAVAAALVEEMRAAVFNRTGFHCSAGIAHNKILAKLVCGIHKPQRQTVLPLSCVEQLFSSLPVRKVRNLGGKFGSEVEQQLGCETMGDLAKFSEKELQQRFDEKTGSWLYEIARGIDNEPVTPRLIPKSIGCSKNFPGRNALSTREAVKHWMKELCEEVAERLTQDLQENKRRARLLTITVSLDGTSTSRSGQLPSYEASRITAEALSLVARTNQAPASSPAWTPSIKMIAISTGKFADDESSRSSVIQNFFKQVPKKDSGSSDVDGSEGKVDGSEGKVDGSEGKVDGSEGTIKVDISSTSCKSKSQSKLDATLLDASVQKNTSKNSKTERGSLESYFAKSQSQKSPVMPEAVFGKSAREENPLIEDLHDQGLETAKLCDNQKGQENSFFLNYLQKLKSESTKAEAAVGSFNNKNSSSDKSNVKNSEAQSMRSKSKKYTDDSMIQVQEMFPNPLEVEDCVLSLLPPSMQETFYVWRTQFRREQGLLSPEKAVQLNSRRNGTTKSTLAFPSPKKQTENQTSPKADLVPSKPKGSLDTFFQKNRLNIPKRGEDPFVEPQPGCSSAFSEDSNSSDLFSVTNENSSKGTERCSICSKLIPLIEFPEHADYHAALSLDEMLNKNNSIETPPLQPSVPAPLPARSSADHGTLSSLVRKRGRRPQNDILRTQRDKKLKSISSFFTVK